MTTTPLCAAGRPFQCASILILVWAHPLAVGIVVAAIVVITVVVSRTGCCCSDRCGSVGRSAPSWIISTRITRYRTARASRYRATGTTRNRVGRPAGTARYRLAWMRSPRKIVTASTAAVEVTSMHAASMEAASASKSAATTTTTRECIIWN